MYSPNLDMYCYLKLLSDKLDNTHSHRHTPVALIIWQQGAHCAVLWLCRAAHHPEERNILESKAYPCHSRAGYHKLSMWGLGGYTLRLLSMLVSWDPPPWPSPSAKWTFTAHPLGELTNRKQWERFFIIFFFLLRSKRHTQVSQLDSLKQCTRNNVILNLC